MLQFCDACVDEVKKPNKNLLYRYPKNGYPRELPVSDHLLTLLKQRKQSRDTSPVMPREPKPGGFVTAGWLQGIHP